MRPTIFAAVVLSIIAVAARRDDRGDSPQEKEIVRPATTSPTAPSVSERLEADIKNLIAGFEGTVGVHVKRLDGSVEVAIRADEVFPTASIVKVPILMKLLDRVEKKELSWSDELKFEKSRTYADHDFVARFADGQKISLAELILLMESFSDNTASLWCQELAGGGEAINAWLASKGFKDTRVNSRTPGRDDAKKAYGWGQMTPREMSNLFIAIRERRAVSPGADAYADRALGRTFWIDEAVSSIPPDVHVISKQGAVNASRSEVLLVSAPSGPFALTVVTKDQKDQSWEPKNAGFRLLRAVTAACWKHLEPTRPYAAPIDGPSWP